MGMPGDGQPLGTLQWLSLLTMAWLMDRVPHVRRAAWLGWVFGTVGLCGTVWWLYISLHTYGHLPAWMAALS